jgi:hypothetical protein
VAEQDQHVPETCRSDQHCRAHDGRNAYPTTDPLCQACLAEAAPPIRGLLFDYLDLAQLQAPAMSQAPSEHTSGGSREAPIPLAVHVEALQAEIVHVTAVWEYELRVAGRLHNPQTFAPLWRSTVYDHLNLIKGDSSVIKARPGALVQRAVRTIETRLDRLSRLPATLVCPAGIDDEPVLMAGWEAVHQLQELHRRSRSILGRTRRLLSLHGVCPNRSCRAEALYRLEPESFKDEPPVWCDACKTSRTYAEYEWFMTHLKWPPHEDDELEEADAEQVAA